LRVLSSVEKPSFPTRCRVEQVAPQSRAIFPVFGGISGSIKTILNGLNAIITVF
jgi:hypothetical protein